VIDTSERGRILPPNLDDRRWKDYVDEARALIPKYAPQWTDHNASDVGITLLELFAWLVEGLTYRLNRVPEKNYVAFLNLLGITRDPATPARSYLVFTAQPGQSPVVPKGTQAQTQATETEAPVIFETDEAVTVLPTNLKVAVQVSKVVFNKYFNVSSSFVVPPADGATIDIPVGQSAEICLGFDQSSIAQLALRIGLFRPVLIDPGTGLPAATVDWRYSTAGTEPPTWPAVPAVVDETDGLQHDGFVRLTVPNNWTSQTPTAEWPSVPENSTADRVADPRFWIGMRISNLTAAVLSVGVRWILFNSASSFNALTIPIPETVGQGTGKPFQALALAHRPLFKRLETDTPYDHLVVQVAGVTWTQVEELQAGAHNEYRVNAVTGDLLFGNYDSATSPQGHGNIPAAGNSIVATAYRYVVGGAAGNVGAGTINALRTAVPFVNAVVNPFAAFGGSDEEPIEDTKRRAPQELRNRYRAVTVEDYESLARKATTDVAIVKCLPPRLIDDPLDPNFGSPWTYGNIDRAPGNVNVLIVPVAPFSEPRPDPSTDLLQEVTRFLDRRRDVTAHLHVSGPRYLPVRVTLTVEVFSQAITDGYINSANDVKLEIENKIVAYLHPVLGGTDGRGWRIGQSVFIAELYEKIRPADHIGFISTLGVDSPGPAYTPATRPFLLPVGPAGALRLAEYELACFGGHVVTTQLVT
jgi:hypothetical protein